MAEVLAIHADQIEQYGGSFGVRDLGMLEAALYRPQTGYYSDRAEQAGALWARKRSVLSAIPAFENAASALRSFCLLD